MIRELNTVHGFDVWVNQQLEKTIEQAVSKYLDSDLVNYYYKECMCRKKTLSNPNPEQKIIWLGKCGIKEYFKKVQKSNNHFIELGCTNARNKGELIKWINHSYNNVVTYGYKTKDGRLIYDYWFGDVSNGEMDCGGDLVIEYFDRIKNQTTNGATTRSTKYWD